MAIHDKLDALRASLPAVETVAYMDLGSGTVLGRSMAVELPQERFDALCALASEILGGASGETDEAVVMRETEVIVVRRATASAPEALGLVCAPNADLTRVMEEARAVVAEAE